MQLFTTSPVFALAIARSFYGCSRPGAPPAYKWRMHAGPQQSWKEPAGVVTIDASAVYDEAGATTRASVRATSRSVTALSLQGCRQCCLQASPSLYH